MNSPLAPLRWTADDQSRLEELQARRHAFFSTHSGRLRDLLTDSGQFNTGAIGTLVEWLIKNADGMRDALAPFDSGVRQANSSKD